MQLIITFAAMIKEVFRVLLVIVILTGEACKSGESEINASVSETNTNQDTVYLEVTVNNLRMRAEPNLTSETKMMLPEAVKVQYWQEHSDTKTEISLRGQQISDYWYLVKYGHEIGWVFGGALKDVEKKDAFDLLIIPGQRVGPVNANDTEQSIINRVGGDLVARGEFTIGEDESVMATYVFPSTEKELILLWDQADFKKLREVRIRKSGSPWKLANGLGIGSSLKDVVAANGGPFSLSGFEWDYAGTTLNWQRGVLSDKLNLIFEPPQKIHKSLIGDHNISSDEPHMVKANPKVKVIRVLF